MQIRLSLSMRSITISPSSGGGGFLDTVKAKGGGAARHLSHHHRCLFHAVLILAFLLPFVFILTALITLEEGVNHCSSLYCFRSGFGPFLASPDGSVRSVTDLHKILDEVNVEDIPEGLAIPGSSSEFLSELKKGKYDDAKTFAITLRAVMEKLDKEAKKSKLAEQLYKHFAAVSIPKGIHCLSLRLTDEYSTNALARRELPSPELLHVLSDNSYYHFVLATDNILAASVVVTSTVTSFSKPEKMVFHIISDKKTYAGMHSWFALNPLPPAIVEVKCINQFDWFTRENVPILRAIESLHRVPNRYHGNIPRSDVSDNPWAFASNLQARSPKYISILNHIRIYLPELFPNLQKVLFLDDDVVIQRDLSPLWDIDLLGRVNGAVETCAGKDDWVMSKRFKKYFNFSHPRIVQNLDPEECAWAFGMNIFDLSAWRKSNIRDTYHYWFKENLRSNMTLWKLGTLPPALIAFRRNVHPIDPSWHLLGLGYQEKTSIDSVKNAAAIHYNGPCKPWLEIGFKHLQPFWAKHVNYSNKFIEACHILEPM